MHWRRHQTGFTLIELLIVVAIIAILALIAVPNFLEAQVRSKVSRVHSDLRSLSTAMESYRIDWGSVPCYDSNDGGNQIDRPGLLYIMLTTPVSYMTSPLRDPFIPGYSIRAMAGSTPNYLDIWIQVGVGSIGTTQTDGEQSDLWFAASFGPDFSDETDPMSQYPYTDTACPYDPTNGTVSRGDIYRHSERSPTNFLSNNNRNVDPNGLTPWW